MERIFVGIDVAKQHLDIHVRPTDERFRLLRDEAGLGNLVERLRPLGPVLVVLEATGGYESIRGRSAILPARPASSPRPIPSTR
jgi:transposase